MPPLPHQRERVAEGRVRAGANSPFADSSFSACGLRSRANRSGGSMRNRILVSMAAAFCAFALNAQISSPPSGGNQRQTVVQQIGVVKVSIDYSSPHVH